MNLISAPTRTDTAFAVHSVDRVDPVVDHVPLQGIGRVSVSATAAGHAPGSRIGGLKLSWTRNGSDQLVARWEIRA